MSECPRKGRIFGGCRFSPRYDKGPPSHARMEKVYPEQIPEILEASKPITYVRDVCERCGKTVERAK